MHPLAPTTTTATTTALSERDAVASLSLMAAQADGLRPEEHTRRGEVFEDLSGVDSTRLFKDVLLGDVGMDDAPLALVPAAGAQPAPEVALNAADRPNLDRPDLDRFVLNRAIMVGAGHSSRGTRVMCNSRRRRRTSGS